MNGRTNPAVVEMRGLSTRIGDRYVHRNLDLRVERGQIVGLVGGSGSGKTTLLRQILGLIQPTAGTVRLFGQDLGGAGAVSQ
ncbi:MAG: ATP-binding cassette domain-containing protein, partial [Azonexus sp.]